MGYWGARGGQGVGYEDESTQHPPIVLGWAHTENGYVKKQFLPSRNHLHAALTTPLIFRQNGCQQNPTYYGSFRLINAEPFHQYVSGKFYDPVFYAPNDRVVIDAAAPCFESPDQYCDLAKVNHRFLDVPAWSSYTMSPAAMFAPEVFRRAGPGNPYGFTSPFHLDAGFRSPSFSQALFPALKTHMLEHHWLQNNSVAPCTKHIIQGGSYGDEPGCEPYYFNHSWESSPVTLFYDGHVENVGVRRTERADGLIRKQTSGMFSEGTGLWSRDTPWGDAGYLTAFAYDGAHTSFHILTTDGIRGRDLVTE